MTRQLTPRGQERRRQLIEHATRRFAENGYHPTSVGDIVSGLGVGKGVFYWYFSSKEELFVEILRESQTAMRRRQRQAIGDEADPVRRIELGIRATIEWVDEHRHVFTLFQFAATDDRFAPVMREGQNVAIADTVGHLKEGIVEGRIRDEDPVLLAHAILGVTSQLARTFVHRRGEPAGAVADAAVGFCLHGLLGP